SLGRFGLGGFGLGGLRLWSSVGLCLCLRRIRLGLDLGFGRRWRNLWFRRLRDLCGSCLFLELSSFGRGRLLLGLRRGRVGVFRLCRFTVGLGGSLNLLRLVFSGRLGRRRLGFGGR